MVDRIEDGLRETETEVREMIDTAEDRFDRKRDQLYADTDRKIQEVDDRLNARIQEALDNPLAN